MSVPGRSRTFIRQLTRLYRRDAGATLPATIAQISGRQAAQLPSRKNRRCPGVVLTFFGFMHGDAIGIAVTPKFAVACGRLWYSNTHPAVIWHWRRRWLASAVWAAGFALRESLTLSGWA